MSPLYITQKMTNLFTTLNTTVAFNALIKTTFKPTFMAQNIYLIAPALRSSNLFNIRNISTNSQITAINSEEKNSKGLHSFFVTGFADGECSFSILISEYKKMKIGLSRFQPFFPIIEQWIGSLHLSEIEKIIRKELKGKSGVYGFLCKSNNKLYIGSSVQLFTRFNEHIKGTRSNIILQNAINKYNLHDFIFIVFEYCQPEDLISREQFHRR